MCYIRWQTYGVNTIPLVGLAEAGLHVTVTRRLMQEQAGRGLSKNPTWDSIMLLRSWWRPGRCAATMSSFKCRSRSSVCVCVWRGGSTCVYKHVCVCKDDHISSLFFVLIYSFKAAYVRKIVAIDKFGSNIHLAFFLCFGLHQLLRKMSGFVAAKCSTVDTS